MRSCASSSSTDNMAAAENIQQAFEESTPSTPAKNAEIGKTCGELGSLHSSPSDGQACAEAGMKLGHLGGAHVKQQACAEAGRKLCDLGGKFGQLGGRPSKPHVETDEEPPAKPMYAVERLKAATQPQKQEQKAADIKKFREFCTAELNKAGLEEKDLTKTWTAENIRPHIKRLSKDQASY